jgi:hypothetical protein
MPSGEGAVSLAVSIGTASLGWAKRQVGAQLSQLRVLSIRGYVGRLWRTDACPHHPPLRFDIHHNARTTHHSRRLMMQRSAGGCAAAAVAKAQPASLRTIRKWRDRFGAKGEGGFADRSSRPHRSWPGRACTRRRRPSAHGAGACARAGDRLPGRSEWRARGGRDRPGCPVPESCPMRCVFRVPLAADARGPSPAQLVTVRSREHQRLLRAEGLLQTSPEGLADASPPENVGTACRRRGVDGEQARLSVHIALPKTVE